MLITIGNAMQAYASFEFWLFNLVDILLNTRRESAAALFYSIKSNRDRNAGVTALVRSVTGDQYITFWRSMRKHIEHADGIRNRLAHGLIVLDHEGTTPRYLVTKPVAYWIDEGPEGPYLTREDIIVFVEEITALKGLIRHFGSYLRGNQLEVFTAKWAPIFAAAVTYPLPADHPLWAEISSSSA
jgi:hypothetical protein